MVGLQCPLVGLLGALWVAGLPLRVRLVEPNALGDDGDAPRAAVGDGDATGGEAPEASLEITGLAEGTVKSRLFRARVALKHYVQAHYEFEEEL